MNHLCSRLVSLRCLGCSSVRRENPAGPELCCSLCSCVGNERQSERQGEGEGEAGRGAFLLRWYVPMMHQCRPHPHVKPQPIVQRTESCLTADCRWLTMMKKQRGWRCGWYSGSSGVSWKVVINEEDFSFSFWCWVWTTVTSRGFTWRHDRLTTNLDTDREINYIVLGT